MGPAARRRVAAAWLLLTLATVTGVPVLLLGNLPQYDPSHPDANPGPRSNVEWNRGPRLAGHDTVNPHGGTEVTRAVMPTMGSETSIVTETLTELEEPSEPLAGAEAGPVPDKEDLAQDSPAKEVEPDTEQRDTNANGATGQTEASSDQIRLGATAGSRCNPRRKQARARTHVFPNAVAIESMAHLLMQSKTKMKRPCAFHNWPSQTAESAEDYCDKNGNPLSADPFRVAMQAPLSNEVHADVTQPGATSQCVCK